MSAEATALALILAVSVFAATMHFLLVVPAALIDILEELKKHAPKPNE